MGGQSPVWECTNVKWWAHSEGLSLTGTAWCTACPRLLYTQLSLERGFSLDNQSRLPQYPPSPWAPLEASHTRTHTHTFCRDIFLIQFAFWHAAENIFHLCFCTPCIFTHSTGWYTRRHASYLSETVKQTSPQNLATPHMNYSQTVRTLNGQVQKYWHPRGHNYRQRRHHYDILAGD